MERFGSIGKPDNLSDSKTHGSAKTLMGPNSWVLLQPLQTADSLSHFIHSNTPYWPFCACVSVCSDQTYTQQKGVRVLSKTAGLAANVVVATVWKPNIAP
jgi:hypothetical protein